MNHKSNYGLRAELAVDVTNCRRLPAGRRAVFRDFRMCRRYDRRRRRWLLQDDLDDRWRLYGRAGQDRELFRFISREEARRLYPRVLRHFRVDEDTLPKPVLKSLKDGIRRGFYALRL
ncbi:hypothetical protein AAVH_30430 [Aphelenchoides avenae]|nr:hypothetical protein AAVH_30430 [Aphelenchus avenae]